MKKEISAVNVITYIYNKRYFPESNLFKKKKSSHIIYERSDNNMHNDYGRLSINVHANNIEVPINNAWVTVTDRDSQKIIEQLRTDSSGNTPIIELPAPPVDYSLEYSNVKPYAEYNVLIYADGFKRLKVEGIQIMPSSTSIEIAEMKYRTDNINLEHHILINEHVLWGAYPAKIPEEEIKPLPKSYEYMISQDVVIPEYVIVHLGTPNNKSAKKVRVAYKDYIKNVACSEIYPTWSAETIRANVIAIISFTLNRVYTDWYHSKGHDFTITNSTAFDQAFSCERNIFEEISVIVDQFFSTYLKKPDIKQPLFTQYCDGKRVKCAKGMKQWEAKQLGDKGYSASDILKYYYGYDTYLKTASMFP